MSSGEDSSEKTKNLIHIIDDLKPYLVANQANEFLNEVFSSDFEKHQRFDIILDNSGIELVADLILADFLLHHNIFKQVHLHFKEYSWFVSDATMDDYSYTIKQLQRLNCIRTDQFLKRINEYKLAERLIFKVGEFWTTPFPYHQMKNIDDDLYADLQKSNNSKSEFF
jgi:hypothetical protein